MQRKGLVKVTDTYPIKATINVIGVRVQLPCGIKGMRRSLQMQPSTSPQSVRILK